MDKNTRMLKQNLCFYRKRILIPNLSFLALGIAAEMVCPERQTIIADSPTRRGTPQKWAIGGVKGDKQIRRI
jgi:hypothetical protein